MKMVALEFDLKQLSLWKLPKQRSEKINFLFSLKSSYDRVLEMLVS